MSLDIRVFDEQDTEAVIALWRECNLVVPWNDPGKDIARKLQVGRELFLVGETDGRIVATVMGGYEGHRGWINYLAVSTAARRRGYGRNIMRVVEARLLEAGCPKINLQVRAGNGDVIAFYEALGYRVDEVASLGKRLVTDN